MSETVDEALEMAKTPSKDIWKFSKKSTAASNSPAKDVHQL